MKIDFPDFTPHPFCRNSHMQTVLSIYVPTTFKPPNGDARKILTHDNDTIVIRENTAGKWEIGDRIVIMLHGLCGSHASQYMMRVAAKLIDRGFKTIRVDMRGFGDSKLFSRGHMHAGRSDDVVSVLDDTRNRYPGSPITIMGFSLGANIALKVLCEYENATPVELDSAVAVSPPIDLLQCTLNLRKGLNRFYDYYFARLLSRAVWRRRRSGIPFDDVPIQALPKQLYEFDDQYTAPAAGFVDATEYYEKCSTHLLLDRISIPTLLLVANDDPIVPIQMYDDRTHSPFITRLLAKGGGHLGFIAKKSDDPDCRWMDWRIVDWVCEIDRVKKSTTN